MAINAGHSATTARVVQAVTALEQGGEGAYVITTTDAYNPFTEAKVDVALSGSFVANLAHFLDVAAGVTPDQGKRNLDAAGLTFTGSTVMGWFEYSQGLLGPTDPARGEVRRFWLGPVHDATPAGLTREIRIDVSVIVALAALLREASVEDADVEVDAGKGSRASNS